MHLSPNNIKEIINSFKSLYIHKRLNSIICYHNRLIVFSFQKEQDVIFINLDNSSPFIFNYQNNLDLVPDTNNFIVELKKYIHKGNLLDIDIIENQRIVKFVFSNTDAFYHHHIYTLYIELIPAHANMVLVNENNQIITSYLKDQKRILFKGTIYEIDNSNKLYENDSFNLDEYMSKCIESLANQKLIHHKEKYKVIYRLAKRKEKTLKKKKESIIEEIKLDEYRLNYIEYGKEILSRIYELKDGDKEFLSYDKKTIIKLDPKLSIAKNAEKYFKEYKKSKKGIEIKKDILTQIDDEIYKNQLFLLNFANMSDEELSNLLNKKKKSIENKDDIKSYYPYSINYKDFIIYYGRNSKQNDYLTFRMFSNSSDVTWFHLEGESSSHVIINTSDINDELINICSYVCLLASIKIAGHILYTNRKNIYRADNVGEANILEKKTKYMDNVPLEYQNLLSDSKRHS